MHENREPGDARLALIYISVQYHSVFVGAMLQPITAVDVEAWII